MSVHQPQNPKKTALQYKPATRAASYRHLGMFDADKNFQPRASATPDTRIDKFTFFGVLLILLGVTLPLVLFPEQGADWVAHTKAFVTNTFGGAYLAFGVLAVVFVVYIAASDIGNIKLGKPAHEPVLNSTSSAGLPSLMLPISEAAIYTTNTTANTPKAK